jgi:hypothetical protein
VPPPTAAALAIRSAGVRPPRRGAAALAWTAALAAVILLGRALAYALAGSHPLAAHLAARTPGPGAIAAALVVMALAAGLAGAALWLASLGVRERAALAGVRAPRLRPLRPLARAGALWALSCVAFLVLESVVHLRAGMSWHGAGCLIGPVHHDALPILAALAILAAALWEVAALALAWARRTVALLAAARRGARGPAPVAAPARSRPPSAPPPGTRRPRAPPRAPHPARRGVPAASTTAWGERPWLTFRDARSASSRSRWRSSRRWPLRRRPSATPASVQATP